MTNSFSITYEKVQGEDDNLSSPLTIKVLPVPRKKYSEVLELCYLLLTEFSKSGGYVGDLLLASNENVWKNMEKLVELIPIAGGGKIDLERMSTEDIVRVFFTRTDNKDESGAIAPPEEEAYLNGEIAKLNGFSFFRIDGKGLAQRAAKKCQQDFLQTQK